MRLSILAAVIFVGACKPAASNASSESMHAACDSRSTTIRCTQKTGGNLRAIAATECAQTLQGVVRDDCPEENMIGVCINRKGTAEETTISYYEGHESDGRTHCALQGDVHAGVYETRRP